MTETTWDTEETSRIIANDEDLYNRAIRLARNAYSIGRLAQLMEDEFSDIIEANPYSEIDINCIEWTEIASEYLGDDEYTDAEEVIMVYDICLNCKKPYYATRTSKGLCNTCEQLSKDRKHQANITDTSDRICIRRGCGHIKDCAYHASGQDCNTCDYDPN